MSAHSRSATLWLRAFATPVVLRREGRRGRPYTDVGPGRAVLVGAVVPVAHAPACVGGIAACTVWMHLNGVSVPVWDGVRESRDVLFGLGASAALGVALVPAFRWAAPSRQSSSRTFGRKVVANGVVLLATSCRTGNIANAIGAFLENSR